MSSIESDWRDRYEWPTEGTWELGLTRRVVNTFLRIGCKQDKKPFVTTVP